MKLWKLSIAKPVALTDYNDLEDVQRVTQRKGSPIKGWGKRKTHRQHVLRHGYQRQRAAAAIELAMMKPGQPLFEVRAPGFCQQKAFWVEVKSFLTGLTRFT